MRIHVRGDFDRDDPQRGEHRVGPPWRTRWGCPVTFQGRRWRRSGVQRDQAGPSGGRMSSRARHDVPARRTPRCPGPPPIGNGDGQAGPNEGAGRRRRRPGSCWRTRIRPEHRGQGRWSRSPRGAPRWSGGPGPCRARLPRRRGADGGGHDGLSRGRDCTGQLPATAGSGRPPLGIDDGDPATPSTGPSLRPGGRCRSRSPRCGCGSGGSWTPKRV